ncbi:TetR/AcrR family transcriptional regulator [Millisia brevis]|uniref:TetR/AcrR family transcriptional regulator n=1 Tax=Millisia brevis TaxID=264148 RepID=UPI000AC4745B|nr:TetR/AcrR family transcriptional regulator [Millisia brevis]
MAGPRPNTKQRMTDAAIRLLRERGAAGVTIDAVLDRSGAPRGSLYHHFPGGRDEILLTAARQSGEVIDAMLAATVEAGSVREVMGIVSAFWRRRVAGDNFGTSCPIVALALDNRADVPAARELVDEMFSRWHTRLDTALRDEGVSPERSTRLATTIVAAAEGAIILARAHNSTDPLDDVTAMLTELLDHSIAKDRR